MTEETKELKMWCVEQALSTSGKMISDHVGNPFYPNNAQLMELAIKIYDFLKEDGHTDTN